jgi:hypothetical protein
LLAFACRAWTRHRPAPGGRYRPVVIVRCSHATSCVHAPRPYRMHVHVHADRPAGRPWSYVHARGSKACMHGSRIDGSIGQCKSITVTRRGSQDVVVFTVVARVHAGVNRCCGGTLALHDTRDMTRHANACRNVTYNITQTGFYVRESTRGRSMDPAAIS